MSLKITPIPAFQDNYIWLIESPGSNRVCVVDPGDAQPVLSLLDRHQLTLDSILITHHHADHTGGLGALLQRFPGAQVDGPADSSIAGPYTCAPGKRCSRAPSPPVWSAWWWVMRILSSVS